MANSVVGLGLASPPVQLSNTVNAISQKFIVPILGDNVFKDAGIKKIEAGTIGKDKKFIPIKGEVEVEPKLVGLGGALEGEVATGAGADITGIAQRVRVNPLYDDAPP